jgi:UDP-N-acetylmuramate dehydrogenase
MIKDIFCKIYENYPLSSHTTLKIGGMAEKVFFPSDIEEFLSVREYLAANNKRITIIGAGSNLLISSKGISGGVIFTGGINGYEILSRNKIKVYSGMKSASVSKIALENNLSGLEFLIGIPGTVGGAVTMNSSAHGQGIEDVIESVEVLDLVSGEISILDKTQLNLGYRYSFVEANKHVILSTIFQLEKSDQEKISETMEFHVNYRKEKHPPLTDPNAGSTFRNPERKVYVGKLLEDLGAKNWQEGNAKLSDKHANFLINTGNATSLDVSRLMYKMYNEVKKHYGYELIAEIRYVGDPTEEEKSIWKTFQVH